VATGEERTVWQKLLLAAYARHKQRVPFSAEELTVEAWRMFPGAFGLVADGQSFPDSHRVAMEIMGSKPLSKNGYLEKVGSKLYQLSAAGVHEARRLSGSETGSSEKAQLDRQDRERLRRLVESRALLKAMSGRENELTFHDACVFWGITPRSSARDLHSRYASVEELIRAASKASAGKHVTLEHGTKGISKDEIDSLQVLNRDLRDRFRQELAIIELRTDDRR